MAEKRSVTVPLTTRQKQQIKRATGKSISALKVEPSGGMIASRRIMKLPTRSLARRVSAKSLARKVSAKSLARRVSAKSLARKVSAKTMARKVSARSLARRMFE